jgi:[calcium/calmodulin-dependent protein kinase] kinase
MKKLNHKNISKLYEVIDDPNSDKLYLVMPLAEFGQSMKFDSSDLGFKPNSNLQANLTTCGY